MLLFLYSSARSPFLKHLPGRMKARFPALQLETQRLEPLPSPETASALRPDGIILVADGVADLGSLTQLSESWPGIPIAVVSALYGHHVQRLAGRLGASFSVSAGAPLDVIAENLVLSFQTHLLSTRTHRLIEQSRKIVSSTRRQDGVAESPEDWGPRLSNWSVRKPHQVLLVESNLEDIQSLTRAIMRSRLPLPLYVVRQPDEAVAYLSGHGVYRDRSRFPAPSIILADFHCGPSSTLDLLATVRSMPEFSRTGFLFHSVWAKADDLLRASLLGRTAYVPKMISCAPLLGLLRGLFGLPSTPSTLLQPSSDSVRAFAEPDWKVRERLDDPSQDGSGSGVRAAAGGRESWLSSRG